MPTITKIEEQLHTLPKRKRVAAYARVSKESDRSLHSLSQQISYYSTLIQKNPAWEYAGVYADDGISGTKTITRPEFTRLIHDCEAGLIDIILTKSISRFARNTVDLLETVRHLASLGIEVRFEKENINSLDSDGELMLTILASFAQEEVETMSQNIKWTIRKKFEKGQLNGCVPFLGYRWDDDKKQLVIVPDEAEIVKRIYSMYLDGHSMEQITRTLNDEGLTSVRGRKFQKRTIAGVLHNITYTGNLLLQKTYSKDPISKKHCRNTGELPKYYAEDTHDAIISMDTYEKVQKLLSERHSLGNSMCYDTRAFTKKIVCGNCGGNYTRITSKRKLKTRTCINHYWVCWKDKDRRNDACRALRLPEKKLKTITCDLLGWDEFDDARFRAAVDKIYVNSNILTFHLSDGKILEVDYAECNHDTADHKYKNCDADKHFP